ncbi:MAG: TRAP transporter small permease [Rhodobacteraceae bacterium]|nr:TRAP transporter small permease [Paracoccaceae bacterium]
MLYQLSRSWAKLELWCSAFLALMITLLILLNVVTRYLGAALFWVDELAIYAMVWMTFFGASAAMHYRTSVSITLLTDAVPPAAKAIIEKLVDLIVFAFALAVVWFCWRWFSPLELVRAGFDTVAFQGATFNFIYAEPTSTLGLPKYMFWSVMWFFAFGATLHSAVHLLCWPAREAEQ